MAKQSEQQLTGVLEIPILTSRTGPMKRLTADLHDVAHQIDQARNAMVRAWIRWREDNPKWQAPPALNEKGEPKKRRDGAPILVSPMHPLHVNRKGKAAAKDDEDAIGFSTYLYHAGRAVAPSVASCLISMAAKEVVSNLQTDVQHHHMGHKFRWQAILANEEQATTFRMRNIPVPNNAATFCYTGRSAGGGSKPLAEFWGKSGSVLQFPIFAKASGRKTTCPIVSLNVGAMSPGNRKVLGKVARGEWKFSDSKIIFKKERWIFQITYRQPNQSLGLNKERTATLIPQFPDAQRPFKIEFAETSRFWQCGNGSWLAKEFARLDANRKRLRGRYQVAPSGVKGHGKKRFFLRLEPWSRVTQNCQRHFVWHLINEVVKFCKTNDCGTIVYLEPSLGIRDSLWLGAKGVPFDWTGLSTNLAFKLKLLGIELKSERTGGTALRERLGVAKPKAQNKTQTVDGNGHATNGKKTVARVPETDGAKDDAKNGGAQSRFRGRRTG